MKRFLKVTWNMVKYLIDVRVLYIAGGIIVSICAHELVHVVMHLGDINAIHLFPDSAAIVTMDVTMPRGYNLSAEELVAYAVTALVQLITIIDVFAIHDSYDRKTVGKLLSKEHGNLSEQDSRLLLQIVSK